MDIACAVSNAYRGCLDAQKGTHDEQDFLTMQERMEHKNEIQDLLKKSQSGRLSLKKGKFIRFDAQDESKVIPEMTEQDIRKYACGPYAMKLARPYVEFWKVFPLHHPAIRADQSVGFEVPVFPESCA